MKKLIRIITPFIAVLFLVGCSGSSDDIVADVKDDIVDAIVDDPSDPKFTSELLVGKTYTTTDEFGVSIFSFTETEINGEDDEGPFTLSYVINEDGVLVIDGDEVHILISIDENGDLHVENDGVEDIWVFTEGTTNPGTNPPPPIIFTSAMLVGKTYTIMDTEVDKVSFTETEVNIEGEVDPIPYVIEDGVLVLEGTDFHTYLS